MALASLVPGTTFAHEYTVGTLIAAGGMGAVYRAEQRSTGNAVALKIMLPELLVDPKSRERFQHEARISGRIRSSHVVKVLAAGIDEATQTPWLAMEFLEGESLAAFAKARGALAPEMALAVLQQVGHALSAAHAAGVVHCDLKPENVFIAEAQTVGVAFDVKVLDFGIARIVKEGRKSASVTTAVGSPHWLAPEQGSVGKTVTPATDVWSFGLLAFWLLTGRYYWVNANVPDDEYNLYALLGEIAGKDAIVPASERLRAFGEGRALLPAGFDGWFARCVDRDVSRRFATAKEAVEALATVMGSSGGASATRTSAPSVPVAATREMTVGVAGLAPAGYPAVGGTERIGERARPSAEAPGKKRGPVIAVIAVVAVAVVGLGVVAAVAKGSGARASARTEPSAPVVTPTPAPTAATVVPPAPPPTCPEGMALIPEGTFTMGSPDGQGDSDEHPAHPVHVSAFCIDRTEVTVAAYRACVADARCSPPGRTVNWTGVTRDDHAVWDVACNGRYSDREDHPINCVDWTQASAYCASVAGRRLPTEAEWEFAARGAEGRRYPWGDEPPDATRLNGYGLECRNWQRARARSTGLSITVSDQTAYAADDGWPTTAPVGRFPATLNGLRDMAGNVWEWTADWYGGYTSPTGSSVSDPTGPATGTSRVIRGGGWNYADPLHFRAADRDWNAPADRDSDLGFRCARGAI